MIGKPTELVLVTRPDTTKPKFHRWHGPSSPRYLRNRTHCGLRGCDDDIFLQVRHAEKFASPCKSKKCFG